MGLVSATEMLQLFVGFQYLLDALSNLSFSKTTSKYSSSGCLNAKTYDQLS